MMINNLLFQRLKNVNPALLDQKFLFPSVYLNELEYIVLSKVVIILFYILWFGYFVYIYV